MLINTLDSGFHLSARHRQAGVTTFYEVIEIEVFIFSNLQSAICTPKSFLASGYHCKITNGQ